MGAALVFVAALVLAAGAAGGAAHREYAGQIKETNRGEVSFRLTTQAYGKVVRGFKVRRIPVVCDGQRNTQDFKVGEGMEVVDGRFSGSFDIFGPDASVSGRLKKGQRASGTVRVAGTSPTSSCDSGELRWTAERE